MSRLDRISTRDAFGEALLQIAKENENVFAIGADTTKSMGMAQMAKAFPQRVVNNGIAEQNMMALAAGVATCGYQVYAASYAPFVSMRALEQVRSLAADPPEREHRVRGDGHELCGGHGQYRYLRRPCNGVGCCCVRAD